jgi:hypothetical protein
MSPESGDVPNTYLNESSDFLADESRPESLRIQTSKYTGVNKSLSWEQSRIFSQSMLKKKQSEMMDQSNTSIFKVREEYIFIFGGSHPETLEVLDVHRDICRSFKFHSDNEISCAVCLDQIYLFSQNEIYSFCIDRMELKPHCHFSEKISNFAIDFYGQNNIVAGGSQGGVA